MHKFRYLQAGISVEVSQVRQGLSSCFWTEMFEPLQMERARRHTTRQTGSFWTGQI